MRVGAVRERSASQAAKSEGVARGADEGARDAVAVQMKRDARGLDFAGGEALMAPPVQMKADAASTSATATSEAAETTGAEQTADATNGEPDYAAIAALVNKEYGAFADQAAVKFNLGAASIKAVICTESSGLVKPVPPKKEGAFHGLMQLGEKAWAAVQQKFGAEDVGNGKTFADCAFTAANWEDPLTNIMFGAAYMRVVEGEIIGNSKNLKVDPAKDPGNQAFSESHSDFATIIKLGYNAGSATIGMAMTNAQSTLPSDFTERAAFEPAARNYDIHKGARNTGLNKWLAANPQTPGGVTVTTVAQLTELAKTPAYQGKKTKDFFDDFGQAAVYTTCDKDGFETKYAEVLSYIPKVTKFKDALANDPAEIQKAIAALGQTKAATETESGGGNTVEPAADQTKDATHEGADPEQETKPEAPVFGTHRGETIKLYDKGEAVRELSLLLRQAGYRVMVSSAEEPFSPYLVNVVKLFQANAKLEPTGIVDPATWDALLSRTGH